MTAQAAGASPTPRRINQPIFCTAPIKYIGQAQAQIDIDNLKAASAGYPDVEPYLPAIAPGTIRMKALSTTSMLPNSMPSGGIRK